MTTHKLVIPGKPIPWSAPQFSRTGRTWSRNKKKIDAIREVILSKGQTRFAPIPGAVALKLKFFFEPPRSWSGVKKRNAIGKSHTVKPDATNLTKLMEDALKNILFTDDAKVAKLEVIKVYDRNARTEIEVRAIDDEAVWEHDRRRSYTRCNGILRRC